MWPGEKIVKFYRNITIKFVLLYIYNTSITSHGKVRMSAQENPLNIKSKNHEMIYIFILDGVDAAR